MNRIKTAFSKGKAFIPFFTCGDPDLETTEQLVLAAAEAGADLIELGIPFSDPIAEGIVIQEADLRALKAGTRIDDVFALVERVRKETQIPLVFLTYLNPVFHYGAEKFFARCQETGMDGIIIPDMPFEERDECAAAAKAHGIDIISMIAPTSKDRIQTEIKTDLKEIVDTSKEVTDVPCAVGFGINTTEQAEKIGRVADGVIVGSAIVKIIAQYGDDAAPHIYDYVKAMKEATIRG